MNRYELINDFLGLPQGQNLTQSTSVDALTLAPYWVLLVLPFDEEVTFYRSQMGSYDTDPSVAVRTSNGSGSGQGVNAKEHGYPLIITSDCRRLVVAHGKDSFEGNLQATLVGTDTNYLQLVFPGDWCMAWILQSEDHGKDVAARLHSYFYGKTSTQQDLTCNHFQDGLKFLGRVTSLRKTLVQAPEGLRTFAFSLQAHSFKELESETYFEPGLSDDILKRMGGALARLSASMQSFLTDKENSLVTTESAVPALLNLLLGEGIPPEVQHGIAADAAGNVGGPQEEYGATGKDVGVAKEAAPFAYLVPKDIGAILGETGTAPASGALAAADLLEVIIGVQKYGTKPNVQPQVLFLPNDLTPSGSNVRHQFCTPHLQGTFLPNFPMFNGTKNVWSIVHGFVNRAVNEMYTTLRVNPEGRVMPTLVARQIPFTSPALAAVLGGRAPTANGLAPGVEGPATAVASLPKDLPYTEFLELPRWHVHPLMVVSADLGRSDAKRCNFVHVYGQPSATMQENTPQAQLVANPPLQDLSDVKRSGLRPMISSVDCSPADITDDAGRHASRWMTLIADWSMGMHLTLDGVLNLYGITAPICCGDNLEFDGAVYHIESVLHSAALEPNGKRKFVTTLTLSHGIRSDDPQLPVTPAIGNTDASIFAAMRDTGQTTYNPGLTVDGQASTPISGTTRQKGI